MQRVSLRAARFLPFASQIATVIALLCGAALGACSSSDPAKATGLGVVSGDGQATTVATTAGASLVVKVTDQNGAPMSGVQVNFTPSRNASVGSALVFTDASGNASTTLTLGTASGVDTITVWAVGIANPAIFTATANPGAPTTIATASGDGQAGTAGSALAAPLVVAVTDQYGNPVPGVLVDWSGVGGIAAPQTVTDSMGLATDTVVMPTATGTETITATVDGNATAVPVKFTESAN